MATLACPHCAKPVAVSPVGRWGSRFFCPHCSKALKFGTATNVMGFAGSFFFFAMMWAVMTGGTVENKWIAAVSGALWLVLVALSHFLRRIEKAA